MNLAELEIGKSAKITAVGGDGAFVGVGQGQKARPGVRPAPEVHEEGEALQHAPGRAELVERELEPRPVAQGEAAVGDAVDGVTVQIGEGHGRSSLNPTSHGRFFGGMGENRWYFLHLTIPIPHGS